MGDLLHFVQPHLPSYFNRPGPTLKYSSKAAARDITEAGVDRILAAVGEKFIPAQLNKAALVRGFVLCRRWYRRALYLSSDEPEKTLIRQLEQTRKTAKRLEQLLASDDIQSLLFWWFSPEDSLKANVSLLVVKIDEALADGPGWRKELYPESFKALSAFDWLAGLYLPDVFELAFGRPPSTSESGPTIRFVEAALAELKITKGGKPYSRASIARAIRNLRAGRIRRKSAVTVEDHYRWWRPAIQKVFKTPPLPSPEP
jgi:hypothetical protein